MMSEINSFLKPLRDLHFHIESCERRNITGIKMWDELGEDDLAANRMTTLIYCLEKAVQFMNIIRNARQGAITRRVWDHFDRHRNGDDGNEDIFFRLPSECVVRVEDNQNSKMCLFNANVVTRVLNSDSENVDNSISVQREESFHLAPDDLGDESDQTVVTGGNYYHLVRNTVYSYKRVILDNRLTDADLKKLPIHTQTLGGQMTKDSILPKGEEHLKARIAQAFFEFTELNREKNRTVKFDIPMFQRACFRFLRYRQKTIEEIKSFFDILAKILWDGYRSSWLTAWRQRKWYRNKTEQGFSTNAELSLTTFPTTKRSFDIWHQSQKDVGSMTLVQSNMHRDWDSGTATIRDAEALYKICWSAAD